MMKHNDGQHFLSISDDARCGFIHYLPWSSKKFCEGGTISVSVLQMRKGSIER